MRRRKEGQKAIFWGKKQGSGANGAVSGANGKARRLQIDQFSPDGFVEIARNRDGRVHTVEVQPVSLGEWVFLLALASTVVIVMEIFKAVRKHRPPRHKPEENH